MPKKQRRFVKLRKGVLRFKLRAPPRISNKLRLICLTCPINHFRTSSF